MAIQMTRAEYESVYGTSPSVSANDSQLDSTPTAIPMTRAEYNAAYRPQELSFFQDARQDIRETVSALGETIDAGAFEQSQALERQQEGQSRSRTRFQQLGQGLRTVSRAAGDVIIGTGKVLLPETGKVSEKSIAQFAETMAEDFSEYNQNFITDLRNSSNQTDRQVASQIDEFIYLYQTDDTFKADVEATGGILEGLFAAVAFRPAAGALQEVRKSANDLLKEGTKTLQERTQSVVPLTNDAAATREANNLLDIENKYKSGRSLNDAAGDAANDSRLRLVRSGVLEGAVDEDGLIRTAQKGGAVDQYKSLMIDGAEDVVKRVLIKENKQVNLNEVRDYLKVQIADSGLEGSDLVKAINSIEREIEGLGLRADAFANLPLSKVQDFKIRATENINYNVDATPTIKLRKAKANAYRQLIVDKSDQPIAEINAELSKFYRDIERLKHLDGKRVKGGRLGRYAASVGGQVIGGFAGSIGGAAGAGAGALVGGEVAQRVLSSSMKRTFGRTRPDDVQVNPVFERARRSVGSDIDLKTSDPVVGVPQGVTQTPETRLLEKQIKDNVKQQKAAIKSGDFALVATLKDVYQTLVKRLQEYLDEAGVGLSIKSTVTPNAVAKKMDIEDVEEVRLFLEDPQDTLLDEKLQRLVDEVGLTNADLNTQIRFFQDALVEVDQLVETGKHRLIDKNQSIPSRRNLNQSDAPITPTTAQNAI